MHCTVCSQERTTPRNKNCSQLQKNRSFAFFFFTTHSQTQGHALPRTLFAFSRVTRHYNHLLAYHLYAFSFPLPIALCLLAQLEPFVRTFFFFFLHSHLASCIHSQCRSKFCSSNTHQTRFDCMFEQPSSISVYVFTRRLQSKYQLSGSNICPNRSIKRPSS